MNEPLLVGTPQPRVDARLKVTGQARYAAEFALDRLVYGVIVPATVARGTVRALDCAEARRAPGVVGVLTPENCGRIPPLPEDLATRGMPGENRPPLHDDQVHWQGQHLAVVIAEQPEQAAAAAALVRVGYAPVPPRLELAAAAAEPGAPALLTPELWVNREHLQTSRGNAVARWNAADPSHRVEAVYSTPVENHHPIEPASTTAVWTASDRVLLFDSTRWVKGTQRVVAHSFGLPPENVRVISPFLGGAFGSKGFSWSHVLLAVAAARLVGRPVKVSLSRQQMFDSAGQRPRTVQTLGLAAGADGRLTALRHATLTHTSPVTEYTEPSGVMSRHLYACEDVAVSHRLARLNLPSPCPMRAPGEATGVYALESAVDELAVQLRVDPLELRLRNYAEEDGDTRHPWSSKHLRACYEQAAEKFGWHPRDPRPGVRRDPAGWLTGDGMATCAYPARQMPAAARVILRADGTAIVRSATHEQGTGSYTTLTQIAADALGLPLAQVRFELGDSSFPLAPINGGSWLTSSVGPAVQVACTQLRQKLVELAVTTPASPLHGLAPAGVAAEGGRLFLRDEPARGMDYAEVLGGLSLPSLEAEASTKPKEGEQVALMSFGAVFVRAAVHAATGEVRVRRVVGVYDCGRVLNPRLARSQLLGGIVFGLGMALSEETIYDPATGRVVNQGLADYHVPVCADVPPEIEVSWLGIPDPHMDQLGVRGIGELGVVGLPAAVANAVYHATGTRVRDLPITPDKLLSVRA